MWLYIPKAVSTSSPSAPEEEGLISASSWQFQALEQCAWWRGKPSQSRHWWQRWKRASFIQLLCGVMPEPSTAERGVAQWTASLVASRASLTALPDESKAVTTPATSGQQRVASSSSLASGSSSLKTSAACSRRGLTKSLARSAYSETFQSLVSRLREDCLRRQRSARAISASGSSSSQWRTPTDDSARGGPQSPEKRLAGGHTLNLQDQVLDFSIQEWPTPSARDWKGAPDTKFGNNSRPLNEVAKLWTTPSAGDGERGGTITEAMSGTSLTQQVNTLWSTPRASDGEKGGPNQAFGAGGQPLPSQAAQWATPRVSSERTSSIALERPDSVSSLSIAQQAEMVMGEVPREIYLVNEKTQRRLGFDPSSLRDQLTYPVGATLSHPRRSLNPLFVEWLMGWPPAWTLVAWTDFACSETELSRFKQRMRSALSVLGLPREAPPAQLALFG